MKLKINVHLDYLLNAPADLLLQIEAASMADQHIDRARIDVPGDGHFARISGEEGIGERIWLHREGQFTADYSAIVDVSRAVNDCRVMEQMPVHQLPGDTVKYLMGSRYCPANAFQSFVSAEFGTLSGGARIMAMRDWIEDSFTYTPGASNADTTARDTFVQRQGICRDYAHVLITMARASAIPARMASVYAIGVEPQDFHAVAEVYLGGSWQLVDPTGMAPVDGIARIGVGRDAADISFMTVYGRASLQAQTVQVERL
ncbi:transglutaminase family protein [Pacificimonas sp. WHA3]|uniref:Transglutaminase family protein n=1 Tax=Pacificimonas pallii TaxID=2827236 RepID=A0ABS6SH67_9SPHN|nr:transglutaminase family protein [Pacificimonas pallii]MBV7257757.1 transglutaminase family protein [Pacificimonas pallii]